MSNAEQASRFVCLISHPLVKTIYNLEIQNISK